MQQTAEAMKSSHTGVHNKQDGSDLKRSRWSGRMGLNIAERKSQGLEISVQWIDRPIVADIKKQSSIYLQGAAKLPDTANVLTRSKRFIGLSKPRQTTSIPLPPISRSRTISGKVECTNARSAHRQKSAKLKEYGTHLPTGNKAAIQDSETHSSLIKQTFDATSTSAPVDAPTRQKTGASGPGATDSAMMMPVRAKHDASLCETRQQRDFCSDDSAIETESEGSEDKGRLERLREDSDDDYYTDQRITEWVLEVNSSLFTTGNDDLKRSKPAEEQDVATIKIIYSGD